jgi:hypothetical protein
VKYGSKAIDYKVTPLFSLPNSFYNFTYLDERIPQFDSITVLLLSLEFLKAKKPLHACKNKACGGF